MPTPTYEFICYDCNLVVPSSQYQVAPVCSSCGAVMNRLYSSPHTIIRYTAAEYVERAARGESHIDDELPAEVVRRQLATEEREKNRGRATKPRRSLVS